MTSKECLKRIDEKNYLTEREHKEFLSVIEKDLDLLEELRDLYEIATKGNWNLKEENTKLKNKNNALEIWNDCYTKENSKLKKAIEILKYIYDIQYIKELSNGNYGIVNMAGFYIEIEKEKAIALKEVIECQKD